MKKTNKVLFPFLKFAYRLYPLYFYILLLYALVSSATTIFGAYTISLIIEALETKLYTEAVVRGIWLVGIEIVLSFLTKLTNYWLQVHRQKMEEKINQTIAEKIMMFPFSYLEDPYYLELKKNAQMGINNMGAIYSLLTNSAKAISSVFSLIGLGAVIVLFDPILLVVLAAGILLNLLLVVASVKTQVRIYQKLLPINYQYGYYMDTLMNDKNSKDFRLQSIYRLMMDKFVCLGKETNRYFIQVQTKFALFSSLIYLTQYLQMAFVYIFVGINTIVKRLPVAQFSLTVSAAISFTEGVSSLISASGDFIRSIEYIKPMVELMAVSPQNHPGKRKLEEIETITFDHVTFRYPNTTQDILKDVSFTVGKNEKISIVGLNGAGKTTIVKLICGLYEPSEGQLKINGIPLYEYDYASYIAKISTVFQDFKLFNYSISENIRPGISEEEAEAISVQVGIADKIASLPNRWQSSISKSYDPNGVELSGGQTQKIAIARALAKSSDLLILDEPTSALDPLAEAEIYEHFNELAEHKTALYISHRMSSSVFCDKILVLADGKVQDFDTHQHLMEKTDGLYYRLFKLQSKNYEYSSE